MRVLTLVCSVVGVAIGVAVLQGAPAPDIGSVAAFQRALLSARAVATIDPAAGGVSTAARDRPAAQALLAWLASPRAQAVLKDKGMEAP